MSLQVMSLQVMQVMRLQAGLISRLKLYIYTL